MPPISGTGELGELRGFSGEVFILANVLIDRNCGFLPQWNLASESMEKMSTVSETCIELNTESIKDTVLQMVLTASPKKALVVDRSSVFDDLKLDSLEKLSIAMDLEDAYELYISDEDIENFTVVGDLIEYLEAAVEQAADYEVSASDLSEKKPTTP